MDKFLLTGNKDTKDPNKIEPRPVQVHPSGGLKVWLEGIKNAVSMTSSVTSLPLLNATCPLLLTQVLLGNSSTTIYTANDDYREVSIFLTNVDTAARTAQVSLGALDDTHSLVKDLPIAVGDRVPIYVPGLATGVVLRGLCDSANKIAVQVWGIAT